MLDTMHEKINVPFIFSQKPESIPPDLRPIWRIALLLLLLYSCRGNRASLKKLHVLNWAIRIPESRQRFLRYIKGESKPDDVIIRFEPSVKSILKYRIKPG